MLPKLITGNKSNSTRPTFEKKAKTEENQIVKFRDETSLLCSHIPRKCLECLFQQYSLLPDNKIALMRTLRTVFFLHSPIHCDLHCPNSTTGLRNSDVPRSINIDWIKTKKREFLKVLARRLEVKILRRAVKNIFLSWCVTKKQEKGLSSNISCRKFKAFFTFSDITSVALLARNMFLAREKQNRLDRLKGKPVKAFTMSQFYDSADPNLMVNMGHLEDREKILIAAGADVDLTEEAHMFVFEDMLAVLKSKEIVRDVFLPQLYDKDTKVFFDKYYNALEGQRHFNFKMFWSPLTDERVDEICTAEKQRDGDFVWGKISIKGRRKSMEDELTVFRNYSDMLPGNLKSYKTFFGVYDGHSGRAAPNFCKEFLHLNTAFFATQGHSLPDSLELAYARTEAEFVRGAAMAGDRSGCTALSLILDSKQRRITVANLGDCRALISRNGQAKEITRDHIPTDSAEADRICSEGGTIIADRVAGKLSVSRTIGDLDKKGQKIKGLSASPELFEIELGDDLDFVLIGCDGLFEQNTSEKLARFVRCLIRVRRCPQKVVEIVTEHLLSDRKATDNLTMILIVPMARDAATGENKFMPGSSFGERKRVRKAPRFLKGLRIVKSMSTLGK